MNHVTIGFACGAAIAALVAWFIYVLPAREVEAQAEPTPPPYMRPLQSLELSPDESIRSIIVPTADDMTVFVCVIYRNAASNTTLLACPGGNVVDLHQN